MRAEGVEERGDVGELVSNILMNKPSQSITHGLYIYRVSRIVN